MKSNNGNGSALTARYEQTINNSTGYVPSNAYLFQYMSGLDIWQEWLIIPVGVSYKIVMRADPNLALTAYGTGDGTSSGTTSTSSGNVFVSEYTGSAHQHWIPESGGKQLDYSSGLRNITTAEPEYSMKIGASWLKFCCPVTVFGQTVTYSSSNTTVATVASNGSVTPLQMGETIIKAEITPSIYYTATLYVTLGDGVYDVTNSSQITIKGSYVANDLLTSFDSSVENTELNSRYFKYKINFIGNGYYSIRSMLNNDMGWAISENNIVLTNIGATNTAVPDNAKWIIRSTANGYSFHPAFNSNTAVTLPTSVGDALTLSSYTSNNILQHWSLSVSTWMSTNIDIYKNTETVVVGEMFDFETSIYSSDPTILGSNRFVWFVDNINIATIDSTTGIITGKSPGTVNITVKCYTNANNYFVKSFSIDIVLFDVAYTQIIQNTSTNELILPSSNAGGDFVLRSPDNALQESNTIVGDSILWQLEYVDDGFYKIKNIKKNKYLKAPESNDQNAMISLDNYSENYCLWYFVKTSDGYYTLQSKNQFERTTDTPLFLSIYNGDLVQDVSSNLSKWNFKVLQMNIGIYYDKAFSDLCGETSVTDVINKIMCVNTTGYESYRSVEQFFKEEFGIKVNWQIIQGNYMTYTYSQNCKHKDDISKECENCQEIVIDGYTEYDYCQNGYHHKCTNKIITSLPESNSTFNVLLSGHVNNCSYQDNYHDSNNLYGRAEGIEVGNNRCALFVGSIDEKTDYNSLKVILVHEIMHLFSISHHYEAESLKDCPHGSNQYANNVKIGLKICANCKSIVRVNMFKALFNHN